MSGIPAVTNTGLNQRRICYQVPCAFNELNFFLYLGAMGQYWEGCHIKYFSSCST